MSKLTQEKLAEIIESHGKWLRGEEGSSRANLSGANLSGANLYEANLSGANLSGANLCGANLCVSNLSGANLCGANLSVSNLSGANLCGANLSVSNLCGADLSGADLSGANLCGANLSGADLPKEIIQVGPIGSRKDQTIYNITNDVVQCGCWNNYKGGSLEDFEARVRQEYKEDNQHFKEYMSAINYFKSLR